MSLQQVRSRLAPVAFDSDGPGSPAPRPFLRPTRPAKKAQLDEPRKPFAEAFEPGQGFVERHQFAGAPFAGDVDRVQRHVNLNPAAPLLPRDRAGRGR